MQEHSNFSRRRVLQAIATGAGALAVPVFAQAPTKIVFGYTAVSDFATLFIAREEGYFSKRGLDVEPKLIPLNPSLPPAIQSDSLQMGGPTPSVFLQAVDGGLDHVVITGGGTTAKSMTGVGLVARAGAGIKTAQDCIGKKVGVPGLGAYLHVSFRAWLKSQGVDHTKVNFIEASFPQHGDLLRGGSIDAVVTADPFMTRIVSNGIGYVASYYTTFLPDGLPTLLYVAKREWVQKNPAAAKGFRESIVEAAAFLNNPKNMPKVREHIGKYIKLPPEVLATIQIGPPGAIVTEKQLAWWADAMQEQKMLRARPPLAKLIAT
jgi:NitT/TauT family transport system substrate-binding protein